MSGIENLNYEAFNRAAAQLRAVGHTVFNPVELNYLLYGQALGSIPYESTYRISMEEETRWICKYADTIALLPGWEASKGCKVEVALAECLKLERIYL